MSSTPVSPEAESLNQRLPEQVQRLLSQQGRRAYFPASGIPRQSQEARAKAKRADATIGIALDDDRTPLGFTEAFRALTGAGLDADAILPYPPALGFPAFREAWRRRLVVNSGGLFEGRIGLPIPTFGVTHAIGLIGDLFIDPGDTVILPDMYWGNIRLTVVTRYQGRLATFPHYDDAGGFNVSGLRDALRQQAGAAKRILYLNAPNNPTGYTPTRQEAEAIARALEDAGSDETPTLVICDEAYYGFFFDDNLIDRHLTSYFVGLPDSILPILVSGPTKELCVWGVRAGCLTAVGLSEDARAAFESKVSGTMRAYNSFGSSLVQAFVARILASPEFDADEARLRAKLRERGLAARKEAFRAEYATSWTPYPFNSGYFCLVQLPAPLSANAVRLELLEREAVGVIAVGARDLRIAFSATPTADIPAVFAAIHRVVQSMLNA